MICIFWGKFKTLEIVYYACFFCHLGNSHFKNQTKSNPYEEKYLQPISNSAFLSFTDCGLQCPEISAWPKPFISYNFISLRSTIQNMNIQHSYYYCTVWFTIVSRDTLHWHPYDISFQNPLETILHLCPNTFMVLSFELFFASVLKLKSCLSVSKYLMTGNPRIS